MASREILTLEPAVRELARQVISLAQEKVLDLLIYCTWRGPEEQARLYRKGRSLQQIIAKATQLNNEFKRPDLAGMLMDVGPQHGKRIVTWAGPGQSLHHYGFAFDAVPMRDGKPVWGIEEPDDIRLWNLYGDIGTEVGLEWAGYWSERKREFPHMQKPGSNWRELIRGNI